MQVLNNIKNKIKNKQNLLLLEKRRYDLDLKINLKEKIKLFLGFPIQKIIGYIEMANVKIDISKKVLIPRYETEELIFLSKKIIDKNKYLNVLDLCCGSGFIGIALKKMNSNLNVSQSDIDKKAIKQTLINNKLNKCQNKIIRSNMFNNIKEKFDILISNPPYLSSKEKKEISKSVLLYEPKKALFAKNNGLQFYEIIEKNKEKFVNKNGAIILEINPLNIKWFIDKRYKLIKDINNKYRFALKYVK